MTMTAMRAIRWARKDWMADGLCHGKTDVFFAPHAERPQARVRREAQARLICQQCPQLDPCRPCPLSYSVTAGCCWEWGWEQPSDN